MNSKTLKLPASGPLIILPRGVMNTVNDVINISKKMKAELVVSTTPEGKFYVLIKNVFARDGLYGYRPLQGLGTTIQDACADYFRLARGEKLVNVISNYEEIFL